MILISSRPEERFESWNEFYKYRMLPLDKKKAKALISKLDYDKQVKDKFLKELESNLFDKHRSFSENPLLLTMMLLTYEQFAEIPNKVHLFYEQAFQTLFNKHDSLKCLYRRKSFSSLPSDEFKKLLSAFSIITYSDRKYYFSHEELINYLNKAIQITSINTKADLFLNDLLDSVCLMQRDGLGYTFTHRSFQEYFTALFLIGMTNKNRYEIFEKIAFLNDDDSVIPMVFDINKELLEQEWIIPRLEKIIQDFESLPNNNEGKLKGLAMLVGSIAIHKPHSTHIVKQENENQDEYELMFLISEGKPNTAYFFIQLYRLYKEELNKYREKFRIKKNILAEKELIEEILNTQTGRIFIQQTSEIPDNIKEIILRSTICDDFLRRLEWARKKLASLKQLHHERKEDITSLILRSNS